MSKDPLVIYTDGRCEPDPGGVATLGWVATLGDEEIRGHNAFVYAGPGACSAVAEYCAVISALEWLLNSECSDQAVVIRTDAQQIAYQIIGSYAVRPQELIPYYKKAMCLINCFKHLQFEWIPRKQNREADKLTRQAYGGMLRARRYARWLRAQKIAAVIPRPDGTFCVPSQSKNGIVYSVDVESNTCTCPFFRKKGTGYCKHILAVQICLGKDIDDTTPLTGDDEPTGQDISGTEVVYDEALRNLEIQAEGSCSDG